MQVLCSLFIEMSLGFFKIPQVMSWFKVALDNATPVDLPPQNLQMPLNFQRLLFHLGTQM
jgi:hypothetical protein